MPREQRTQLNKRRGTEVPLGKYGSGRTQTVNMPAVAPVKSDGAKLAEAFGMAAQAAGKIVSIEQDKTQKRKAIFDAVEGKGVGNAEAQRLIKEANDLPLEQRNQHIQQGMSNWLENYRGADTTDAFLRGGLQGFTGATDKFEASNNNALLKIQENKLMTATISSLKTDVLNNETHANMIDTIKTVNDVGNAQAGEIYVKTVAAIIKEEAQTDPNYDWQEAVNTRLKVITKDGVDYASHPTYGSMIDGLESSLTTLATARTTAMTKANKQVAVNTSKSILATLYRDDVTPEELVQAQEDITNNQEMFTLTQFKTLETALDNAKDETGYAHTSNPELFSKAKVLASTGKLSTEALNMWKSTLTKSEYNQVFASAVKHEEEIQDTGISLLKNGINDLEKAGRRQVAEINEFGIVMNPQDAAKVTMYDGIWNSYLINYQQENGVLPPYKEVIKEQKDIVQQVKNAFDEEGQEIGTPIPTTDVGGERTGLDKQEWLQTATTDEIRQGLEDGSIKASELQPTSSIMDSVVDVFSPTTLQADEELGMDRVMKDFLKGAENNSKVGRDFITGLWEPHTSVEGGNDTIGYGHKLTNAELESGTIHGINYKDGLNDDEIETILEKDIVEHEERAARFIQKKYDTKWGDLTNKQQDMLALYEFNGVLSMFPGFTKAVLEEDWETVEKEYKVYSGGRELGRNEAFKNVYINTELMKVEDPEFLAAYQEFVDGTK